MFDLPFSIDDNDTLYHARKDCFKIFTVNPGSAELLLKITLGRIMGTADLLDTAEIKITRLENRIEGGTVGAAAANATPTPNKP